MEDIPGKVITDKNGQKIKMCTKCDVPIFLSGAFITCSNDCYIGEINWRPEFTDERPSEENDFNPVVTKMCPDCKLEGALYKKDQTGWYKQECQTCGGKGAIKEKKYEDDNLPVLLEVDEDGKTKCPKCNFKFKVTDPNVWQGNRHKRCGQLLEVPNEWLLYWPQKANK